MVGATSIGLHPFIQSNNELCEQLKRRIHFHVGFFCSDSFWSWANYRRSVIRLFWFSNVSYFSSIWYVQQRQSNNNNNLLSCSSLAHAFRSQSHFVSCLVVSVQAINSFSFLARDRNSTVIFLFLWVVLLHSVAALLAQGYPRRSWFVDNFASIVSFDLHRFQNICLVLAFTVLLFSLYSTSVFQVYNSTIYNKCMFLNQNQWWISQNLLCCCHYICRWCCSVYR